MMLSIFPEAADSSASQLWNGRKIRAVAVNFLAAPLVAAERVFGVATSSRPQGLATAENRPLNPFERCALSHRLRCCPLNLQFPARVRPNALEHARANRFQFLSITTKPTPSRSLAN